MKKVDIKKIKEDQESNLKTIYGNVLEKLNSKRKKKKKRRFFVK